jgi:Immunity protein Imm1
MSEDESSMMRLPRAIDDRACITIDWAVIHADGVYEGMLATLWTPAGIAEFVDKVAANPRAGLAATRLEHSGRRLFDQRLAYYNMFAAIVNGYGYLSYEDETLNKAYVVGDPASPGHMHDSDDFPAGSGVPLATFTAALVEWLASAERPTVVQWRDDPEELLWRDCPSGPHTCRWIISHGFDH